MPARMAEYRLRESRLWDYLTARSPSLRAPRAARAAVTRLPSPGRADIIAVDICKQAPTVPYPMATPEDLAETVSQVEALDRRIIASQVDIGSSARSPPR